MSFEQFATYAIWLALLIIVCLLFRAVWFWLDRFEVNTKATAARADLEDAQAQKIRASLRRFEVHGGRIFFIDGNDDQPYIEIGSAPLVTASGEPVDSKEIDVITTCRLLVERSKAKYTASGNQIITYEESNIDHNVHAAAVKWLATQGMVWSTNRGIFLREMTLSGLEKFLNLNAAMLKLPTAPKSVAA
jgi:hypothetical protein